jgi:hypothetical protein
VLQTRNYGASRRARSGCVTPGKYLRHPLDRTRPGFRGDEKTMHIHAELWGFSRDTSRKLHTTGTCTLFCWVGTARSFIFSNPGHWVITHNYSMNYTFRVHVERGPLSHLLPWLRNWQAGASSSVYEGHLLHSCACCS